MSVETSFPHLRMEEALKTAAGDARGSVVPEALSILYRVQKLRRASMALTLCDLERAGLKGSRIVAAFKLCGGDVARFVASITDKAFLSELCRAVAAQEARQQATARAYANAAPFGAVVVTGAVQRRGRQP